MLIYHCCVCENYELRHQWLVSSIVEQRGESLPDIHLDVATLRGNKSALRYPAALANQKNRRVTLTYHPTPRRVFAYRGKVRDEQCARALAAGADWIFFADCDRVYHPGFFDKLARQLRKHALCDKLIAQMVRKSTDREKTDRLIESARCEAFHHPNAFWRVSLLPLAWRRRYGFASGGMQVIRRERLLELGGRYTRPKRRNRDQNMFTQGQLARSDVWFRFRVGGSKMVALPDSIHLEHARDKEAGCHLTAQR